MTNHGILETAMRQSALEMNCGAGDFLLNEHRVVVSAAKDGARAYLTLPFHCNLVSYGDNVVASAKEEYVDIVRAYLGDMEAYQCFVMENLHRLEDALAPFGLRIGVMARYFLPDMNALTALPCPYETRLLGPADFVGLYRPE